MAAKKKTTKKSRAKKVQARSRSSKKSAKRAPSKKITAKKTARRSVRARKAAPRRGGANRQVRDATFESRLVPALSGDADSQGLSDVEQADSESVKELIDEGNPFEAGAVSGVERADDADGKEVRTREFPEDDVPQEYLDEQ